jgi:hypothetical protein
MPPLGIDAAARSLCDSNLPILFVDTCVLLDVIQRPFRVEKALFARRDTEGALRLRDLASGQEPRLSIVTAQVVAEEWARRRDEVTAEVRTEIERHDRRAEILYACAAASEATSGREKPSAFAELKLERALLGVAETILESALVLERDVTCELRAHRRSIARIPPSRRGTQGSDCEILEHCLELCRRLDAAGASQPRVFISSNTKDYYGKRPTRLHPLLQGEFAALSLEFVTTLGHALHACAVN